MVRGRVTENIDYYISQGTRGALTLPQDAIQPQLFVIFPLVITETMSSIH